MKKISILIPCYNEKDNVLPMTDAIVSIMEEKLSRYDYELIFIDNCSTDGTREKLEQILYSCTFLGSDGIIEEGKERQKIK